MMEIQVRFDRNEAVEEIQTHTSRVFLVGEEVLKIKKPVLFSFLDYSTIERRKECCEKEVALNRRFSPEVYMGVVPLTMHPEGDLEIDGPGEIREWAVRMRRLPAGSSLSERLARGEVRAEDMTALADILADFYRRERTDPEISRFGDVAQIRENTEENFETTLDFPEGLLPDATRQALRSANRSFLESNGDLFAARIGAGRILDGHGDLKPENIFITSEGPVVTDCIEFNDRFRYGDVLADLGYLTMGLRAAGRLDLREAFLRRFGEVGEPGYPEHLLGYYETYRAVVKGKIEGYRSLQAEVPAGEREEAARIALAHFLLAEEIAGDYR